MSKSKDSTLYDVAIIGGGINGAVSAARLSASGLKVLLLERGDYASTTSQESSNLVWGGIKYLQSYEFGLVYKLCRSRNQLMRCYPNRIREIGFLASIGPTSPFGRVLGLFGTMAYWVIGGFATKIPKLYLANRATAIEPSFIPGRAALEYFDAELPDNDSRFVWDFIATAKRFGAQVCNYSELVEAQFDGEWNLLAQDAHTAEKIEYRAKSVVNATGPFAAGVSELLGVTPKSRLVLSKGVHLIVPKIHNSDRVLAFWDEEGRMFYVLPMGDRSMIGTTDTRVDSETKEVTQADRDFLLRQINKEMNLERPLVESDIISERCGVRPLVAGSSKGDTSDWHKLSRKHVIETAIEKRVVTVFGGKLTDCLNVGDEVFAAVKKFQLGKFGVAENWYGEESKESQQSFEKVARPVFGNGPAADLIVSELWRRHGSRALEILELARTNEELREPIFEGLGICGAEVRYVLEHEQVKTADDLLRRRLPIAMCRSASEIAQNIKLNQLLPYAASTSPKELA
jgi:glycerol-3-phosphate dehydrogenase